MTLAQHVKEKTAKPVANAFWTLVRTVGPDDRKVYDNLIGVFSEFINVKDSADRFMGKVVANQVIADTMFLKAIAEYRKGLDVNPLFLTKRVGLSNTWGKAVAENKPAHDAVVRIQPSRVEDAAGVAEMMPAQKTIVAALDSELEAINALTAPPAAAPPAAAPAALPAAPVAPPPPLLPAAPVAEVTETPRIKIRRALADELVQLERRVKLESRAQAEIDAEDELAVKTGTADAATQERVRARLSPLPVDNRAAEAEAKAAAAAAKAEAAEAAKAAAAANTRDMELREAERNVTKLFTGLRVGSAKDADFPFVLKLPQIKSVINTQEPDTGKTLLMYATEQLMRDAVKRLILAGAKTDLIDSGRRSAFHYIARAPVSRAMYVKAPPPAPDALCTPSQIRLLGNAPTMIRDFRPLRFLPRFLRLRALISTLGGTTGAGGLTSRIPAPILNS
jgi:hypothetical protein